MLNNFVASEDITSSVDKGLAVLMSNHLDDIFLILLKKILVFEHVTDTGRYGNFLPGLEGIFGASDSLIEFSLSGFGDFGEYVLGEGTDDVNVLGGLAVDPLSIDVVLVYLGCEGAFVLVEHLYF